MLSTDSFFNLAKLPFVPMSKVLKMMEPWELFQLSTLNSKFIDVISMASINSSIDIDFHVDYTRISIFIGQEMHSEFFLGALESSQIFHVEIGGQIFKGAIRDEEVAIDAPADIFLERIFKIFKKAPLQSVRIFLSDGSENLDLNSNFPQKIEKSLRAMENRQREMACDSLEIANCDESEEISFDSWRYQNILKHLKIRENLQVNCVFAPSASHVMRLPKTVDFEKSENIKVEELSNFIDFGAKTIVLSENRMESRDFRKILVEWVNGNYQGLELLSVEIQDELDIMEVLGGAEKNIVGIKKKNGMMVWQIAREDGVKAEVNLDNNDFWLEIVERFS